MTDTYSLARKVWDYHVLNQRIEKCDCVLALGNSDLRTAERAGELFIQGYGRWLITTGGFGRLTSSIWNKSEAEMFADVAVNIGVPQDKIILEDKATNTFDNLRFTEQSLAARNITASSFLIVTKPYMERRASAMVQQLWPDKKIFVTSPALTFDQYPNETIPKDLLVNMLVGDLQRIIVYGERGESVKQEVPKDVLDAYQRLIQKGYDKQLINYELPKPPGA